MPSPKLIKIFIGSKMSKTLLKIDSQNKNFPVSLASTERSTTPDYDSFKSTENGDIYYTSSLKSAELSYLAAPVRKRPSPLLKMILAEKMLTKSDKYLDYGCGRGFDFTYLRGKGYNSIGYDPYYFPYLPPEGEKFDLVTLNYVLNVLEDPTERIETVKKAWSYTKDKLIVTALTGKPAKISQWGTFSEGFSQLYLRALINVCTGKESKSFGSGKFIVSSNDRPIESLSKEEVEKEIAKIKEVGFVAPIGAYLQQYYVNKGKYKKYYYRYREGNKCIHINSPKSEKYKQAIASINRRNRILSLKFNCGDFCYLDEFQGMNRFKFM